MKSAIKKVKNRFIRLLCGLDQQEGFVGMLLVMIISVSIFTILSSVHIYTVNHSRYQSGIKEAYIMQTEVENFATIVSDAYNKGRNDHDCSLPPPPPPDVCCVDDVPFKIEKKLGAKIPITCGPSGLKLELGDNVCIKSSSNKDYCLVKIAKTDPSLGDAPCPTTITLPVMTNPQDEELRACLFQKGTGTSCTPNTTMDHAAKCSGSSTYGSKQIKSLCQDAGKYSYNLSDSEMKIDDTIQNCCNAYKLSTINCNCPDNNPHKNTPPETCMNYETWLNSPPKKAKQKMWCEICEMDGPKRLFTYYVCPATAGTPPDPSGCITQMGKTTPQEKAQSGVFYQTFRIMEH